MGADGWQDLGPWDADPNVSLRALQRQRFDQQYSLPRFVADRLADGRSTLRHTQGGNLPPDLKRHLLEVFAAGVAYLEAVQARPLPIDLAGQLEVVRRVCGADGCGGVLDVTSAGSPADPLTARVLSPEELLVAFGTPHPTLVGVGGGRARLPDLGRGECLCFPVFDEARVAVGWQFVGRGVD